MPFLKTSTGIISYKSENGCLTSLVWGEDYNLHKGDSLITQELQSYFKGQLKGFSFKVLPQGTGFQQKVWQELLNIPYGEVVTYKDVADKINSHPRAVGMAVGKNPIPIVIPCHRVIGKNGKLTGFSGGEGLKTKKQLLELEELNK